MSETNTQEIATIPVEDFKMLAEAAPVALEKNTALLEKAKASVSRLLVLIDQEGMDDEKLAQLQKARGDLKTAKEKCFGRRSLFTRALQSVTKVFTGVEKEFDEMEASLAKICDNYAAEKIRKVKEEQAAQARKLAYDKEKVEVRSKLELELQKNFLRDIELAKSEIFKNFNGITLDNFPKAEKWFTEKKFEYTPTLFNAMQFFTGSTLLSGDDINALKEEVKAGKFEEFKKRYEEEVDDILLVQRDRLNGKKKELEEIRDKEAEAARLRAAAKTKAEKAAAEGARLEAERQKQEAEERKRQQEIESAAAAEKAKRDAETKVELEKDVAMTNTLFEHESETAGINADKPEGRDGYEIVVVHQAGYQELFSFWYKHEASKLPAQDIPAMEKKTLKQMKTFAEKMAHKDDKMIIHSKFLVYSETFKTAARK
jgi:hypothetical protein